MSFDPMPPLSYVYRAKYLLTHDGDTIHVMADLGFSVSYQTVVRLHGLNCPELMVPGPDGKSVVNSAGSDARKFTSDWLVAATTSTRGGGWPLIIQSLGPDKYGGRWQGYVWRQKDGRQLNADLLSNGFAVPMAG